jgi:hypothetical protein
MGSEGLRTVLPKQMDTDDGIRRAAHRIAQANGYRRWDQKGCAPHCPSKWIQTMGSEGLRTVLPKQMDREPSAPTHGRLPVATGNERSESSRPEIVKVHPATTSFDSTEL